MPKKKETKQNEYVMMDPSKLVPYENNPRLNAAAVDYVANSIQQLGFGAPILVDKDMVIIAGHTRRLAAMKLGLKEVPVVVMNSITPDQARAMRLADNKSGEQSGWDLDALDIELDALDGIFDMEDFGFLDQKYEMFDAETEEEEDEGIPVVRPEDRKLGVYVECTSEDDQRQLMDRLINEGRICRTA